MHNWVALKSLIMLCNHHHCQYSRCFHHSEYKLIKQLLISFPQTLESPILLLCSMNLPILVTSYRWDYTIVLLCLNYLKKHNVFKALPCIVRVCCCQIWRHIFLSESVFSSAWYLEAKLVWGHFKLDSLF